MCPIFQIQTHLLPCLFLASLDSFYVPVWLFGAFYFISSHQWTTNKIHLFHQSYQSIINQLSLPDFLLDVFCSHWDFCELWWLLEKLDSHQSSSSISSVWHAWISSRAHLNFIISWNALLTPQMTLFLSMILALLLALFQSSLTSLTMSNAAFLSVIFQRSTKYLGFALLSTILLTSRDNLSTYHKCLIIYHHLKLAFSVLKSFIRIVEERALPLEIGLRFIQPIMHWHTFW